MNAADALRRAGWYYRTDGRWYYVARRNGARASRWESLTAAANALLPEGWEAP